MVDNIVLYSNEAITRKCNDIKLQGCPRPVNRKFKAFIGLLFLTGALRISNCNLYELWSI